MNSTLVYLGSVTRNLSMLSESLESEGMKSESEHIEKAVNELELSANELMERENLHPSCRHVAP